MSQKRKSSQFKLSVSAIRNISASIIAAIYFALMFAVSFYMQNNDLGLPFMF